MKVSMMCGSERCEANRYESDREKTKRKGSLGKGTGYGYKFLFLSCFVCFIIRIFSYFFLNVLEGETNEHINLLVNIESAKEDEKRMHVENSPYEQPYYKSTNRDAEKLLHYYQQNKRYNIFKEFFKHDSMQYAFNSHIFNFTYLYDSYILNKAHKNVYHSLTVRINPLLLKALHWLIFTKIRCESNSFLKILNNYEFRYYILITLVDILIGIFLFCIVRRLAVWRWYFDKMHDDTFRNKSECEQSEGEETPSEKVDTMDHGLTESTIRQRIKTRSIYQMEGDSNVLKEADVDMSKVSSFGENEFRMRTQYDKSWNLINPLLLINIYLNNPFTILSNVFLSLDNLKLLVLTLSFYFTVQRISSFCHKVCSLFNILTIIVLNATLLYISSFHFLLPIIGITYFVIYLDDDINTYYLRAKVHIGKILRILIKMGILIIATVMVYLSLLIVSAYFNENTLSFLNNTVINEYKIMFVFPNLGNYWYLFSLMFETFYDSFLFLFHFHIFIYVIPLMLRLMKTPLMYLHILQAIALLFHPNITVNDIIYSLLLLSIDYKNTMASTPLPKMLILFICQLGLYFVSVNLWLRKNTANANYVFFNQIVIFNVAVFIVHSSLKRYILIQTPNEQLLDRKRIVVSKKEQSNSPLSRIVKKIFS